MSLKFLKSLEFQKIGPLSIKALLSVFLTDFNRIYVLMYLRINSQIHP
jgi:hypothetical protein